MRNYKVKSIKVRNTESLMRLDEMTEEDVRTIFITPSLVNVGWDPASHMKTEYCFTDGRVIVNGHRGELSAKMDAVLAEITAALEEAK